VATDSGQTFTVTVSNSAGNATSFRGDLDCGPASYHHDPSLPVRVCCRVRLRLLVVASGSGTLTLPVVQERHHHQRRDFCVLHHSPPQPQYNGATFTVKVTNAYGNVTSSAATLTVNSLPPSPPSRPTKPLRWGRRRPSPWLPAHGAAVLPVVENSSAISGATSASYTTPATVATDGGSTFTVQVTSPYGNVTSSAVTLTVNLPPTITTQPASQTVLLGATATFSGGGVRFRHLDLPMVQERHDHQRGHFGGPNTTPAPLRPTTEHLFREGHQCLRETSPARQRP